MVNPSNPTIIIIRVVSMTSDLYGSTFFTMAYAAIQVKDVIPIRMRIWKS